MSSWDGFSLFFCLFVYGALAWGRLPGFRLDRAAIAWISASILIFFGKIDFHAALQSIDGKTLVLLFSMMVLVGFLRVADFFNQISYWTLGKIQSDSSLLAVTVFLSGILSAVLVNDVVCVAMTPFVLTLCQKRKLNPIPFLLALATASNIGSACTPIGNPQNMMIAHASQIPFSRFVWKLLPISLVGLFLNFALIHIFYKNKLKLSESVAEIERSDANSEDLEVYWLHPLKQRMLKWGLSVLFCVVIFLFLGFSIVKVAMAGAALLWILCGKIQPRKIYAEVDWALLLMFSGLFIVVDVFEKNVLQQTIFTPENLQNSNFWREALAFPVLYLGIGVAGLSNLVSNVPGVLLMKPLLAEVPKAMQENTWLSLALCSTLAGNLTVLGSVANLIVVESARRRGVWVSFWDYARLGIPLTFLTLILGLIWLSVGIV